LTDSRIHPQHVLRDSLERVYLHYNRREFIHPDPLEFLWNFESIEDREIVGLIASGLAYGRVTQILRSTDAVLNVLGPSPSAFLQDVSPDVLSGLLAGFKHRFTTPFEITAILESVSTLQREWGILGNMLKKFLIGSTYQAALENFVSCILEGAGLDKCSLLPLPSKGSACKRLHLFMRWMIRHDEVDPGGWEGISSSELVIPLDVHMLRAVNSLGFTDRKNATLKTALEATEGFRRVNPEDPVKYDFALTRMGIQGLHEDPLFRELFFKRDFH